MPKTYNPVRLTSGPKINYGDMLRNKANPKDERVRYQQHEANSLESLGIKGNTEISYKRDAQGNLVLDANGNPVVIKKFTPTEIPAYFTHAIMVLNGHEPCYFEGCEQIVDMYNNELELLKKRPGGCRDCDKARLQRKFASMFRNALPPEEANKIVQPTMPPYKVTNVATREVTTVPRHPIPYATIRREIPPEVKEAFTKMQSERKLMVNNEIIPLNDASLQNNKDSGTPETSGSSSAS